MSALAPHGANTSRMLRTSSLHVLPTEQTRRRRFPGQTEDSVACQSAVDLPPAPVLCSPPPYSTDYLRLILDSKVYDAVEITPLTRAESLSDRLQCNVLLKREELQPIFSYKLRGVYNKMAHLDEAKRWRGVITYSTGNYALAVAYSAKRLRMPSIVVLPLGTSDAKLQNLSRLGSTLILHGATLDAAKEECFRLQQLHGLTYVPACKDPYLIAGHGTIGPEILKQANIPRVKAIFCPLGCGTLIAGLGIYMKRVAPHVKIIGVESKDISELFRLEEHVASRNISDEMVRICAEVIDDIVQVDIDEVYRAIKDVYEETRNILEPTGVMSLAGLKKWITSNELSGSEMDVIAITSEANVDFFTISDIIQRVAVAEKVHTLEMEAC